MSSQPFRTLSYDLLDVFTLDPCKPYTGNPLAVVYNAEALSQPQLQTIARDFNLSETTFPSLPSEEEKASGIDYNVRIFTALRELPFAGEAHLSSFLSLSVCFLPAGHPSLGTCFSLLTRSLISPPTSSTQSITQSCLSGRVTLLTSFPFSPHGSLIHLSSPHKYISPNQLALPSSFKSVFSLAEETKFGIVKASSCGLTFLCVQVEDEKTLAEAKGNGEGISQVIAEMNRAGEEGEEKLNQSVFFFCAERGEGDEGEANVRVRARLFFNGGEDPATGSANIALGPVLLQTPSLNFPPAFTGTVNYTVTQGLEMGRPSQLFGRVVAVEGKVKECWIGGGVVKVGEGWIRVPEA